MMKIDDRDLGKIWDALEDLTASLDHMAGRVKDMSKPNSSTYATADSHQKHTCREGRAAIALVKKALGR